MHSASCPGNEGKTTHDSQGIMKSEWNVRHVLSVSMLGKTETCNSGASRLLCPRLELVMGLLSSSKATITIFLMLNALLFTCVSCHKNPLCPPQSRLPTPSAPKKEGRCPKDTLKFGVCGSWLGLIHEVVGTKPSEECCRLIAGVADVEAAVCLCTAIKANVLGVIKLKIPVALTLLVNACGNKVPQGFVCS